MMRVPKDINNQILDFARSIQAETLPRHVSVSPAPDAAKMDCFANVRRVVSRLGGRIVWGWSIWEWSQIYVEAEHHAIYESPQGQWVDVTPPMIAGTVEMLFLPDDSAVYDFSNEGVRRRNRRVALRSDPLIKALFSNKEEYDAIQDSIPGVGTVRANLVTYRRLKAIEAKNLDLTLAIAGKFLGRNDPCFCGSGKKFKKCHAMNVS